MSRLSDVHVRNFIFGVEDSLVSTVGMLAGIAIAGVSRETILLAGVVLILVEAFSMAAGSFLSERSAQEYRAQGEVPLRHPIAGGTVMFFSYFISGFIPLFPYIVFTHQWAFFISIALSLVALFGLGAVSARMSRMNLVRGGMRMLVIGGVAIGLGAVVGTLFDIQ